jgi:hypothetical protein
MAPTPEGSRRHQRAPRQSREGEGDMWGDRRHLQAGQPACLPPVSLQLQKSVLHLLMVCISAVAQGWFDPRAQDWCSTLYKQAPATPKGSSQLRSQKP